MNVFLNCHKKRPNTGIFVIFKYNLEAISKDKSFEVKAMILMVEFYSNMYFLHNFMAAILVSQRRSKKGIQPRSQSFSLVNLEGK